MYNDRLNENDLWNQAAQRERANEFLRECQEWQQSLIHIRSRMPSRKPDVVRRDEYKPDVQEEQHEQSYTFDAKALSEICGVVVGDKPGLDLLEVRMEITKQIEQVKLGYDWDFAQARFIVDEQMCIYQNEAKTPIENKFEEDMVRVARMKLEDLALLRLFLVRMDTDKDYTYETIRNRVSRLYRRCLELECKDYSTIV